MTVLHPKLLDAVALARRERYGALKADEALTLEDVVERARDVLRAEREGWTTAIRRHQYEQLDLLLRHLENVRVRLEQHAEGRS